MVWIRNKNRARILAAEQLSICNELHDIVGQARAEGVSWRAIADTLGMNFRTLHRQWSRKQPIVVRRIQRRDRDANSDTAQKN